LIVKGLQIVKIFLKWVQNLPISPKRYCIRVQTERAAVSAFSILDPRLTLW